MLDDRGCYLQVNAAWERLFGRSRQDVLGKPAADVHPTQQAQAHEAIDRQLREQGGSMGYETWIPSPQGQRRLHVSKLRLPEEQGSPPCILCLVNELPPHVPGQGAWSKLSTDLAALLARMQGFARQQAESSRSQGRDDAQTWLDWDEQVFLARCALRRLSKGHVSPLGESSRMHGEGDLSELVRIAHAQAEATLPASTAKLRWQLPAASPNVGDAAESLLPLLRRLFWICLKANAQGRTLIVDLRREARDDRLVVSWSGIGEAPDVRQGKVSELASALEEDCHPQLSSESLSGSAWRVMLHLSAPARAAS